MKDLLVLVLGVGLGARFAEEVRSKVPITNPAPKEQTPETTS